MAPGYVLAIVLEAAGLLTLTLGVGLIRFERRAKAAELKRFLSSGQSAALPVPPTVRARPPVPDASGGVASPSTGAASEAVLALRRAFAAPLRGSLVR